MAAWSLSFECDWKLFGKRASQQWWNCVCYLPVGGGAIPLKYEIQRKALHGRQFAGRHAAGVAGVVKHNHAAFVISPGGYGWRGLVWVYASMPEVAVES